MTWANGWRPSPGGPKKKPHNTLNIGLTAAGLRALGLSQQAMCTMPEAFHQGMSARERILGDLGNSAPRHWEIGGSENPPLHAVAICYADSRALALAGSLELHGPSFEGVEEVWSRGGVRSEHRQEPFGFRDGTGQPEIGGIKGWVDRNTAIGLIHVSNP